MWASWGASWGPLLGLLGACWGLLGSLEASWGPLGASWGLLGSLGASWGPLGASWGPLLEPSWGPLRPSWKPLGLSWGPSWAVLGPSWAPLGPSWDNAYWGPLGRSWSDGKLNSRELQKPSKTNGKIMSVASWGPLRRPLGGLLGRLGGLLGRLRAILGVLERSFVGSGPFSIVWTAPRGGLGPFWGPRGRGVGHANRNRPQTTIRHAYVAHVRTYPQYARTSE